MDNKVDIRDRTFEELKPAQLKMLTMPTCGAVVIILHGATCTFFHRKESNGVRA